MTSKAVTGENETARRYMLLIAICWLQERLSRQDSRYLHRKHLDTLRHR